MRRFAESRYGAGAEKLLRIIPELTKSERRILVQGCVFPNFEYYKNFWEYVNGNVRNDYDTVICNIIDKSNYRSSRELDLPCCVFWEYEEVSEIKVLPKGLDSLSDRDVYRILENADPDEVGVRHGFEKEIDKMVSKYDTQINEVLDL